MLLKIKQEAKLGRVFVTGKPFLSSLIFASKSGCYLVKQPKVVHLWGGPWPL